MLLDSAEEDEAYPLSYSSDSYLYSNADAIFDGNRWMPFVLVYIEDMCHALFPEEDAPTKKALDRPIAPKSVLKLSLVIEPNCWPDVFLLHKISRLFP